jgi:hypothetical protein
MVKQIFACNVDELVNIFRQINTLLMRVSEINDTEKSNQQTNLQLIQTGYKGRSETPCISIYILQLDKQKRKR